MSIFQLRYVMNDAELLSFLLLWNHLHLPASVLGGDNVSASRTDLNVVLSVVFYFFLEFLLFVF